MSLFRVLVVGPLPRAITALITGPGVTSLVLWCLMLLQSPEREEQGQAPHMTLVLLSSPNVEFVMAGLAPKLFL